MKGLSRILFTLFYITINNIQIGKDNDETELSAFFVAITALFFYSIHLFLKWRYKTGKGKKMHGVPFHQR